MKNYIVAILSSIVISSTFISRGEPHNIHHLEKQDLGALLFAQDTGDTRRFQIRSLDQTAHAGLSGVQSGLSGSSCGYHALRNGILCASALMGSDASLGDLSAANHANELFGSIQTPWRIAIMQQRFKPTARRLFRDQVLLGLRYTGEATPEFNALMYVLNSLDPREIHHPEVWEDGFKYSANKDAVYVALWERMTKLKRDGSSHKPYLTALLDRDRLDDYFGDVSVDFRISFNGDCYATESPDELFHKISGDRHGRWVRNLEMPALVDELNDSPLIKGIPGVTIATYGDDRAGHDDHAFATEQFSKLYSTMRNSQVDCVGIVLMYLSAGNYHICTRARTALSGLYSWVGSWFSGTDKETTFSDDLRGMQSSHDNGHWISLVVARVHGKTRFYVSDSLANIGRLRDPRVDEVIAILDGKKELPGYEWTKKQLKVRGVQQPPAVKHGSWTPVILGTGLCCVLGYAAYSLYKKQQSDKKKIV